MFEKKISETTKVTIKDLRLENGKIFDEDGVIRDLNKVVALSFKEGSSFTFTVNSKEEDVEIVEDGTR